ncbi:MAG TPA: hypothetical protein PK711_12470 [Bacteroidales bacterium]|nr:hypothetical protein [Bacteroidales bacterium]
MAQVDGKNQAISDFSVSIHSHNIAFPMGSLSFQNWGILLNCTHSIKSTGPNCLSIPINIDYFNHQDYGQGISLDAGIQYKYLSKTGLFISAYLGVGYLQSFERKSVFFFSDGQYSKKNDISLQSSLLVPLSFHLGYKFRKSNISAFIGYRWSVQYPYFIDDFPILPHGMALVGVGIPLQINN